MPRTRGNDWPGTLAVVERSHRARGWWRRALRGVAVLALAASGVLLASHPRQTFDGGKGTRRVTLAGLATARMRTTDSAVRCSASDLRVVLARKIGAAGTGNYYFTATNHGKATCTINGFFHVTVLGAHRRLLTGNDRFTPLTPSGRRVHIRRLLVKPRSSVTTMVSILENPVNGATTCPYITAFLFRAPNSEATADVTVRGTKNWFCAGSVAKSPCMPR